MSKLSAVIILSVAIFFIAPPVLAIKPSEASPPGRVKLCQVKEAVIKNRSTRLASSTENMLSKFDSISSRVQDVYNNKNVPQGKVLANYDALLADIKDKQASAQAALQQTKDDVANFSCTLGNPKEQLTAFRQDMQEVKKALKDYRFTIKNLIVAVRSVTGQENRSEGGR